MRTESTAETIAKVGEIIRQTPTTEIAQSCVLPILSEIALSLAAIADRLNETSGIEGISMDEVTEYDPTEYCPHCGSRMDEVTE